jgi:hypothetical protein
MTNGIVGGCRVPDLSIATWMPNSFVVLACLIGMRNCFLSSQPSVLCADTCKFKNEVSYSASSTNRLVYGQIRIDFSSAGEINRDQSYHNRAAGLSMTQLMPSRHLLARAKFGT